MRLFGGERIATVMQRLKIPEGEPIEHSMITKSVERAQKKVEENNFSIRKRLLEYDDVMNQQRVVIYTRRNHALKGDRLKGEIFEYLEEIIADWYAEYHPENNLDALKNQFRSHLLSELNVSAEQFQRMNQKEFIDSAMESAKDFYRRKEEMLGAEFMARLETVAALQTIDDKWREHLRAMDDLKEGINLRSYGQKDPLLEYKKEAYDLFVELLRIINKETVSFAFKYFPRIIEREVRARAPKEAFVDDEGVPRVKRMVQSNMRYQKSDTPNPYTGSAEASYAGGGEGSATTVRTYKRDEVKVGRNDPCPCGSGKKYKNCHGRA
jgi:preprotein translocase subunit SecA